MLSQQQKSSDEIICDAKRILLERANSANRAFYQYASGGNGQVWGGSPFTDFIDERTACAKKEPTKEQTKGSITIPLAKCGPYWTLTKDNERLNACAKR
jgi:hypothetical protein